MDKEKMLITASTFPRWEGDTEPRFILDYAKAMMKYYDVTVLAPVAPGAKVKEVLEGVDIIRYHYFPIHQWETLCYPGAIVPRIREKKIRILLVPFMLLSLYIHLFKILPQYDVVHVHWLIPQGIVQSFFKKPYIVTGHGGDVTSLNKGILRQLKIRCLRRAKHVMVVSNYLKEQVQKLIPEINPTVISMGVDTSKFGKKYFVKNYFGQGDKKVVLFVGRLAEKKGVAYLIEAMRTVDAILVIVGDGPLKKELFEQAKDLGDKIIFLGAKTHEELKVIYASSDVFVAPSITAKDGDQEGLPTTIMEAMASGLPIVASNSGGISQLVKNRINGILCEEKNVREIAEALNVLISDKNLFEQVRERASLDIKKYDYSVISKQYNEIMQEYV